MSRRILSDWGAWLERNCHLGAGRRVLGQAEGFDFPYCYPLVFDCGAG